MTTIDAWVADVDWRLIDRDYAYGAQCWDLAADYAERVVGCPITDFWTLWNPANPDHTLVSSIWLYWPVKPGIVNHFTRLSRHDAIQKGDVLIWARSPNYPASHIAVALDSPTKGGYVLCMTQNPAAAHAEYLPLGGLLGILRPINPAEEDDMFTDEDRKLLQDTLQKANQSYDALFIQTPTSRGSRQGVLGTLAAVDDALFKPTETSFGTPGGVLKTLRAITDKLGITKPDEEPTEPPLADPEQPAQ